MKQYLNLLKEIKEKGTWKNPARENMPKTLSLFGAQYRCSLSEGFPLLTTKEISFKNIVTELLWFLRGDTNIKYLVDNGCNIWNKDTYNYYKKVFISSGRSIENIPTFKTFTDLIKNNNVKNETSLNGEYHLGDCGWQYGRLWRKWDYIGEPESIESDELYPKKSIDQISELIKGLKENPESRRHILTGLNPAHYNDLALFPCHVLAQFNCRPLTDNERYKYYLNKNNTGYEPDEHDAMNYVNQDNIPKYYLDCSMYQRSADVFLGVPYNTASYSLLTHILSEILGMIPGDLIHTFGDVHIYENHMKQVDEQLTRTPDKLPKLNIGYEFLNRDDIPVHKLFEDKNVINNFFNDLRISDFSLTEYNPQPSIKAKLSTGLK